MKSKLPILVIIPHGGYRIPEELSGYQAVNEFDLFMQADTCANEIFDFSGRVSAMINIDISRLFIDLDRPYKALPPDKDGVMKKFTLFGKDVFKEDMFPDEIAIANLLQRYYVPFHKTIKKILSTGEIKLVLECHTMMPVGPRNSRDSGMPRPIVRIENCINDKGTVKSTCPDETAMALLEQLSKGLAGEDGTIVDSFTLCSEPSNGYILKKYSATGIPIIRLVLSKSLFINDKYFSYDFLKVDEIRLRNIRDRIWKATERFYRRHFQQ